MPRKELRRSEDDHQRENFALLQQKRGSVIPVCLCVRCLERSQGWRRLTRAGPAVWSSLPPALRTGAAPSEIKRNYSNKLYKMPSF